MTKHSTIYHRYHATFDGETKNFVSHQSRVLVEDTLRLLEDVDELRTVLEKVAKKCHQTLKHHASMVETLGRNPHGRGYNILIAEDIEVRDDEELDEDGVKEEERETVEEEDEEEMWRRDCEIRVGDMVKCVDGKKLGNMVYCEVVDVSPSKKTYVLKDKDGNKFRKYEKYLRKNLDY